MSKRADVKKAAASSAVSLITATGVLTAGAFDTPAEFLKDPEADPAILAGETFSRDEDEIPEDSDGEEDEEEEEEKRRPGLRAAIRRRVLALPLMVRAVLVLPLWLLGSGVLFLLSGLWSLLSPALGRVLSAAFLLALVFGAFLLAAKAAFPDLPLKKLLNRKTLPVLLVGGALLSLLDLILNLLWPEYETVKALVEGLVLLLVTGSGLYTLYRQKEKWDRPREPETEEIVTVTSHLVLTDASGTYTIPIPRE